jgi:serine/threonine protein kinase
MEDLVATVEDARYVNAVVQDDKPQSPWKFPSEEELAEWVRKKEKEDPKYLEESTIIETISGKYLYDEYCNTPPTPVGTGGTEKAASFKESPEYKRYLQFSYIREKGVSEADFLEFRVLGKGGFGQVKGVRKKATGNLYALKTQLKKKVKEGKAEKLVKAEWGALQCVESDFIVKLHYAYHNEEALFLILEIATGGDLNYALKKERPMNPERARYYAGCIVSGLGHLHKAGLVYRDLKPENILLTKEGRCKISDLGLACQVTDDFFFFVVPPPPPSSLHLFT